MYFFSIRFFWCFFGVFFVEEWKSLSNFFIYFWLFINPICNSFIKYWCFIHITCSALIYQQKLVNCSCVYYISECLYNLGTLWKDVTNFFPTSVSIWLGVRLDLWMIIENSFVIIWTASYFEGVPSPFLQVIPITTEKHLYPFLIFCINLSYRINLSFKYIQCIWLLFSYYHNVFSRFRRNFFIK